MDNNDIIYKHYMMHNGIKRKVYSMCHYSVIVQDENVQTVQCKQVYKLNHYKELVQFLLKSSKIISSKANVIVPCNEILISFSRAALLT